MRSRFVLTAILVALSLQLALVPFAGTVIPESPPAPELTASVAAQEKQPSQRAARDKSAKKKTAKKKRKQKQRRARQARQARAGDAKKRDHLAARQQIDLSDLGPPQVPRVPGGLLPSAEREVARAQARSQDPGDRYIVLYADEGVNSRVATTALDTTPGVIPFAIYEHAVKGFAAYLTPDAKQALERDPRVASVRRDRQRYLTAQTMPRGISRVGVQTNPEANLDGQDQRVDVDIAIIDTGIDFYHPDLNVFAYGDCTGATSFQGWDRHGHGTHVAGTAAAKDNGLGVVGVAPGARIWAFKVEDNNGNMFDSYIIACMDIVTRFAAEPLNGQMIDVANMSLGGVSSVDQCGVDDAFNDAVCGMVDAGVTVVVAAGNDSMDAANFNPANLDEVITVSALADSDGARLGLAGPYDDACTDPQPDDSLATFSNFGADVDIAAPGVGILSTVPTYFTQFCVPASGIGYDVFPGTSMASPHVAGAAGLLLAQDPDLTPEQVRAALLASREQVSLPGDPDGIDEGVLYVGAADNDGPSVKVKGRSSSPVRKAVPVRVTASDPSGVARAILYRCMPKCRVVRQDAVAPYKFVRRHKTPGRVRYKVRVYDNVGNFTETFKVIKLNPKQAKKSKQWR